MAYVINRPLGGFYKGVVMRALSVKVKVYSCKVVKGRLYYYHTENGMGFMRSVEGDEITEFKLGRSGKLFIKNSFSFKGVKYLTANDLRGMTGDSLHKEWAGAILDKAGFNY